LERKHKTYNTKGSRDKTILVNIKWIAEKNQISKDNSNKWLGVVVHFYDPSYLMVCG
jgi:hypothetical protein